MKKISPLHATAAAIESRLATFYGFEPAASVVDFLIELDASHGRGSVFLHHHAQDEELEIGVHIHPHIRRQIEKQRPFETLSVGNLDPFCVLVEEISHFHLILNRAKGGQSVTLLELEWQGEVDKLLLAAMELRRQYGNCHYHHLARLLFEESEVFGQPVHEEASSYAARFWYRILGDMDGISDPRYSKALRALLRQKYKETWQAKVSLFEAKTGAA